MACPFCATGQAGLTRNLSTAEIVDQVVAGARLLADGQVPGGPRPRVQHRLHGDGGAAGQLRQRAGRGAQDDRTSARGPGHSQRSVTVSTVGLVPAIARLAAERLSVTPGRVPARPGRRAARHPGAGKQPVEGGRGAGRRVGLRRGHRPPGLHRVRPDQGHERPGLARRSAGRAAAPGRLGARQPDPAEPDTRVEVDRVAARGRSASSSAGWRRTASRPRCATPAAARSTAPAASWPPQASSASASSASASSASASSASASSTSPSSPLPASR